MRSTGISAHLLGPIERDAGESRSGLARRGIFGNFVGAPAS